MVDQNDDDGLQAQINRGIALQHRSREQWKQSVRETPPDDRTNTALAWVSAMLSEAVHVAACVQAVKANDATAVNNHALQAEALEGLGDVMRKVFSSLPIARPYTVAVPKSHAN
jgi:hypothetical protein